MASSTRRTRNGGQGLILVVKNHTGVLVTVIQPQAFDGPAEVALAQAIAAKL